MTEFETDELKSAYDLLDVPYSAAAPSINQAYRRIAKRWHPDRYRSGTPAYAEATQMMKRINEAHALIENAPLLHPPEQRTSSSNQTGPEPSKVIKPGTGSFWKSLYDVLSYSRILRRIVLFPIALVVCFPIFVVVDRFPGLVHPMQQNISLAWVLGVLIAIIACCLSAQQFWDFRYHLRLWVVLVTFLVLHFRVVVPVIGRFIDVLGTRQPNGTLLILLGLAEILVPFYLLRLLTAPLARERDRTRLSKNRLEA